ncbi:MAG: hypothetical protein HY912_14045 [Desulfomonile tiedjei]|uniref:Uncharacterized protein n=1 Tax=Desulfomonile tiedjei TaxID=2358 RepID=A0A9D6V352_9BACT|nr:hypothetical protein [Desulfomonile tiedjei]
MLTPFPSITKNQVANFVFGHRIANNLFSFPNVAGYEPVNRAKLFRDYSYSLVYRTESMEDLNKAEEVNKADSIWITDVQFATSSQAFCGMAIKPDLVLASNEHFNCVHIPLKGVVILVQSLSWFRFVL